MVTTWGMRAGYGVYLPLVLSFYPARADVSSKTILAHVETSSVFAFAALSSAFRSVSVSRMRKTLPRLSFSAFGGLPRM